ncbi:hypothetical protein HY932_01530 [Candidatus Falkowbacteria bacterium]|nr:hypothetical protein [Candidatus Falkowbacteria bacterium]
MKRQEGNVKLSIAGQEHPEQTAEYYFDLFREASGANQKDVEDARRLFLNLPKLKPNAFEAGKMVRDYLKENGFSYDSSTYKLQDVIKFKKGNCLSLSLIIGLVMKERGVEPKFQTLVHPIDAVYQYEMRLFDELKSGEHFDFHNPVLPDAQADVPQYYFAPVEHPVLLLDDKHLETTSISEDETSSAEPDSGERIKAESTRDSSFEELVGQVYFCRVVDEVDEAESGYKSRAIELCKKSLAIYPRGRESWGMLYLLAEKVGDEKLKNEAKEEYSKIGGDDSLCYFSLYGMTEDPNFLNKALERFPAYADAFTAKNVRNMLGRVNEARFNFAVAAWCVANSCVMNLRQFYKRNQDIIIKLFGKAKNP